MTPVAHHLRCMERKALECMDRGPILRQDLFGPPPHSLGPPSEGLGGEGEGNVGWGHKLGGGMYLGGDT